MMEYTVADLALVQSQLALPLAILILNTLGGGNGWGVHLQNFSELQPLKNEK